MLPTPLTLMCRVSTETNKFHNLSVALLHLLLNTPLYGAVNAHPSHNPAPSESLVGKHHLALFNWPASLSHMKTKKPEDAPGSWSALTVEPNPFTQSPCDLDDAECHLIAAGISHLLQNCPNVAEEAKEGKKVSERKTQSMDCETAQCT